MVIEGARDGVADALVSSASPHADLWREVKALQRDHGGPTPVRKTKAHRTQRAAEQDDEDNIAQYHGNRLADEAAKTLARSIARADPQRARQNHYKDVAVAILGRIAVGAAHALRHKETHAKRQKKNSRMTVDEGSDDEVKHIIKRKGKNGLECSVCRRMATGDRAMTRLRREACSGAIANRIDDSHKVRTSNGIVWCESCGAYMTRWPRRLLNVCANKPQSEAQRNVLRRLQAGLPPTTAGYLAGVAETHGAPANARAHEDEAKWRRGVEMTSANVTFAKSPTGVYARLHKHTSTTITSSSLSSPPSPSPCPFSESTPHKHPIRLTCNALGEGP